MNKYIKHKSIDKEKKEHDESQYHKNPKVNKDE